MGNDTMRTAKVFQQGNSQAVRLPKEFRFQEVELYIRKHGDAVILIPKKAARWQHVKNCLGRFKGEVARVPRMAFEKRDWPE